MKFCIIIELLKYLQLKCKILYYDCAIEIYQRSVFFSVTPANQSRANK